MLNLFSFSNANECGRSLLVYATESSTMNKLEVAVGLEPTKVGFADRRLDHFGIATLYPKSIPKPVPKPPTYRLFIPYNPFASR